LFRRLGEVDLSVLLRVISSAFGLADEASLEAVRADVREMAEQVGRLRERELALAGGVSQLRAKAARFDEALAGLARVQGKCVARLDGQVESARKLEHLAGRRDDHITRLIRDTAGQRAELERISADLALAARERAEPAAEARREASEVKAKLGALESQYADLKRLQAGSTQRVIETLESMRDRVSKLELRAAEMSREARAKAGRIDALARHVATVEGRLTTAIGPSGEPLVPVATEIDQSVVGNRVTSGTLMIRNFSLRPAIRAAALGCALTFALSACSGGDDKPKQEEELPAIASIEGMKYYVGGPVMRYDKYNRLRLGGFSGEVAAPTSRGLLSRLQGGPRRKAFRLSHVLNGRPSPSRRDSWTIPGCSGFPSATTFDSAGCRNRPADLRVRRRQKNDGVECLALDPKTGQVLNTYKQEMPYTPPEEPEDE
jgi:hypothetical protein